MIVSSGARRGQVFSRGTPEPDGPPHLRPTGQSASELAGRPTALAGRPCAPAGRASFRCSTRAFLSDHRIVGLVVPLTDAQWAGIEPLLPDRTPRRGGRWRDHRQVIDAIAWKFQTGSQWVHLPAEYGSWKGVYTRLRNWAIDGTWERVFTALLAQADADGDLEWVVAVDSTIVRVHQNGAGARKKGLRLVSPPTTRLDDRVAG